MPTPDPILTQLYAEAVLNEAGEWLHDGEISLRTYNAIDNDCRTLKQMAKQQMALNMPRARRNGNGYDDRRF